MRKPERQAASVPIGGRPPTRFPAVLGRLLDPLIRRFGPTFSAHGVLIVTAAIGAGLVIALTAAAAEV